ncbi:RNA 3'-terminal phosphate cyclase [Planctomycetota bacterium]
MIEIDGSFGEGGGQILRSSVALSAITQTPIVVTNIRANRRKPGLMRQHFAAISAAKEVCAAKVEGLELHSTALTFDPGKIRSGNFHFSIGTAGSTSLVLQTVMLPLLLAEGTSCVRLEGGTHNPMTPPFNFISKCFVPQVARMGADVDLSLERYGFVPAGGGIVTARINPIERWRPLELTERGEAESRAVRAVSSGIPKSIVRRELKQIQAKTDWPWTEFSAEPDVVSGGPGNVVSIELQHANVGAVFTGFGRVGRRAEVVATDALKEARVYMESDTPVCEHLADQLLLPMAIAADRGKTTSRFVTHVVSSHTETHMDLIKRFMPVSINVKSHAKDRSEITVSPKAV